MQQTEPTRTKVSEPLARQAMRSLFPFCSSDFDRRPVAFSLLPFLLIFSLLPAALATRTTPIAIHNRLTVLTVGDSPFDNSTMWRDFGRFLDLKKGSEVTGVSELKKYFNRFGYLPSPVNVTDVFDSSLESAVLDYQKKLGLPVTGKFDSETINLIMSPRCGMGDSDIRAAADYPPSSLHKTKHYAFFNGKPRWTRQPPMTLTYAFSDEGTIDYISKNEIRAVFTRAFARWAKVIPMNFTEVDDYRTADIKIGFYSGDHGDGEPFDGVLGVLGHAFSPESGRLHFDGAERWAVDFSTEKSKAAIDLESVATHEIGHVLGLAHSSVKEAIMYPTLRPRSKKTELRIDDVEGIQDLYGSNPDFKFSSLLESDETSNGGVGGWKFGSSWWRCWAILLVLVHFIWTL